LDKQNCFKNKKILITGSNGFVGRNLVEKLSEYDCYVYGIGVEDTNKNQGINYYKCDITNHNNLKKIILDIKPNYVFNLAAIVTAARDYSLTGKMIDLHIKTLFNFYEILKEEDFLDLFINFGSTEEYGDYDGKAFKEDFFEKSNSPYAATKTAAVHLAYMFGHNEKFPIISVRPGVLFGEYQDENKFVQYVINQLKNNNDLKMTPGEQTRDFIYIQTFIELLLELIQSNDYSFGDIYNIASGESLSLKEFVLTLKDILKSESKINFGALEYRENEIMNFNVSIEKLKNTINRTIDINLKEDLVNYINRL